MSVKIEIVWFSSMYTKKNMAEKKFRYNIFLFVIQVTTQNCEEWYRNERKISRRHHNIVYVAEDICFELGVISAYVLSRSWEYLKGTELHDGAWWRATDMLHNTFQSIKHKSPLCDRVLRSIAESRILHHVIRKIYLESLPTSFKY